MDKYGAFYGAVLVLSFSAASAQKASQEKCKNVKSENYCLFAMKNEGCKYKKVRDDCPRACMVCCGDLFVETFCKSRKFLCYHPKIKLRLKFYCPKTCGYCGKVPAPPPCLESKYGCCWDKSTPASAPIGSGKEKCPPCADGKSERFCKNFQVDCSDWHPGHVKGKQIRKFCPKTCRVCGDNPICIDDPKNAHFCSQYKIEGLCSKNEKFMRFWCPKTCGFCKPCYDRYSNCAYLKKHRACEYRPVRMKVLCQLTCNMCS